MSRKLTRDQALASVERRWRGLLKQRGPDECWPWTGYKNPRSGYGQLAIPIVLIEAGWHRTSTAPWIACRLHHGEPFDGAEVLHSCANYDCCNPAHLRWGTRARNMQDRVLDGGQNTRKLTPDDVRSIRQKFADRPGRKMVAYEQLAIEHGVSIKAIREVIAGESWGWLT